MRNIKTVEDLKFFIKEVEGKDLDLRLHNPEIREIEWLLEKVPYSVINEFTTEFNKNANGIDLLKENLLSNDTKLYIRYPINGNIAYHSEIIIETGRIEAKVTKIISDVHYKCANCGKELDESELWESTNYPDQIYCGECAPKSD